jgi:O-antigen/teichoic acid export membrane protein
LDTNARATTTASSSETTRVIPAAGSTAAPDPRRHQHWDVRNFFSNYGYLITGNALNALFSFLNIWLATHALGASGYGAVAAVMAAGQAVLMMAVNWTVASLARFGTQEFVERGKIAESFWTRGGIALVTLAALLATYPLWSGFLLTHYHLTRSASWLLGAFVLSTALSTQMQFAMQAAKRPRETAIVLLLERVLVFAGLVWIVTSQVASLTTVVTAYVTGALIAAFTGMVILRRELSPFAANLQMARKMIGFSLPLMATMMVGFFSTNFVDAFFILKYLSLGPLGVYTVGFQYAGVLMQLPTLAGSLLLPFYVTQLAHGREDRIRRFLMHAHPMVTLLWSLTCVLAGAVGAAVVPRILSSQFADVGKVIWPLVIANAVGGPILFGLTTLANAQDKTYKGAIAAVITAGVNVALDIVLIPRFGAAGCAWATTAAYSVSLLVWLALSYRHAAPLKVILALVPAIVAAVGVAMGGGVVEIFLMALATFVGIFFWRRREFAEDLGLLREAWARTETS